MATANTNRTRSGKKTRRSNNDGQANHEKDWLKELRELAGNFIESSSHPVLVQLTDCFHKLTAAEEEGKAATRNYFRRHGELVPSQHSGPTNLGTIRNHQWQYAVADMRAQAAVHRLHQSIVDMQTLLAEISGRIATDTQDLEESRKELNDPKRKFDYYEYELAQINYTCAAALLKMAIHTVGNIPCFNVECGISSLIGTRYENALSCVESIPKMPELELKKTHRHYFRLLATIFGALVSTAWQHFGNNGRCCVPDNNFSGSSRENEARWRVRRLINETPDWEIHSQNLQGEGTRGLDFKWPKSVCPSFLSNWWKRD